MALQIYNQFGKLKATVEPSDSSTQNRGIMSDNQLSLSFTLYEFIGLDVNDYIDFCGSRYWMIERYVPRQKSTVEWSYEVVLYGIESLIKRFLVLFEGEPDFTLTAPAHEHAALIVKSINDGMGSTDWKVGNIVVTDNITVDYSGTYCDEGLKEVATLAEVEWWVEGQTINISRCEHGEEITLTYGRGITSLERDKADNVKFYTRLFPIGSSRNIDQTKYGHKTLQLPAGKKYIDINTEKYGIIHHYEREAFSGIYPSRIGEVTSVRKEEVKDSDGNPFVIYYFKDNSLNFDPNDYEIGGLVKQVTFQTGELSGRDFEVNFNSKTGEFEIITVWPYDDDTQLPGGLLVPEPTDTYILWNLRMPDEYYPQAEQKLLQAVEEFNSKHGVDVSVYKCPTDYIFISENNYDLFLGRRVRLESREFFPELGYRSSRITKITRNVNNPAQADLEISDALSTSGMQKIEDSIAGVANIIRTSSKNLPDIIRCGDNTLPTDNNLYSARRSRLEFIKKQINDTVHGILTFIKRAIFQEGAQFGESFASGMTGTGGLIDGKGNAELESAVIRRFLEVPEIRYNRTDITIGNSWRAPGAGIIESVDTANQIVTLKLQDGEIGAVHPEDICMGIFHSLNNSENATADTDDSKGNFTFAGFITAYFTITDKLDNNKFRYQLRPISERWKHSFHPREAMTFVSYGNFSNTERQTSMYETRTYRRMLWRQNTWEIGVANIAAQDGDLTNLNVHGLNMEGYSTYLSNVYFTGTIKQVKPDGSPVLTANDRGQWKAGHHDFYDRVSHNGGLWLCVNEDGTDTEPSKSNNNWLLQVEPGKDGQDAEPGEKGDSVSYVGEWQEDKYVPYLGLIRINEATWICTNKNGTTCGYLDLINEEASDLTNEEDYDLQCDEIDMSDFALVAEDGEESKSGKDGKDIEFIYTRTEKNTSPAKPATYQQDNYIPTGWTDNPEGVSETNIFEWVAVRHKSDGRWSEYSAPSVWAKWGEKGQDGDGLEYIFRLTAVYINPATPSSSAQDGYVPEGWTDNPSGVTESLPHEWVCQRKKRNGVWGDFSAPAIWARYSKDGKDGQPGRDGEDGVDGQDGKGMSYHGEWKEGKAIPYLGVIRINDASWMCQNEKGTICGYLDLINEEDADLTNEEDFDLQCDEIDMSDFVIIAEDGNDGKDGQEGVGVDSIAEHYYLSSSATTLADGAWTTSRPAWQNGWYIWTRKVFTFSNGRTVTTEPICTTGGKGDEGKQGIQGCIIRKSEWQVSVEFRNDEGLTSGTRYVDIALQRDIALETGWQAFKCLKTHTSTPATAPGNTEYWEPFPLNVNAIFTSLIIAKDAEIEFLQGNQLLMKDDRGSVIGGLSGEGYYWMGGPSPYNAMNVDRADGSGHRAGGNIAWDTRGNVQITGQVTATSGKIGGFTIESGSLYWKGYDYFGNDSRSVRIGVPTNEINGMIDISFNLATSGRFGVRVIGSAMGGAGIYASSKSSGQTYPVWQNSYAGYFDGGVHINGGMYCSVTLINEIGTSWELNSDGSYTYRKGVSGSFSAVSGFNTRTYTFVNGILVQIK